MKKTKKMIRNFILFILLIVLTFFIILKDANIYQIINALLSAKKGFILIAIMCMLIYFSCEAINIKRTLKALGEKTNFWKNLKYSLIGFFFSSITPAASGGQPMQVYYMHKDGIPVAKSTLTLLINLSCVQIATITLALFSLIFNYQYMNTALIWFFVLGITLNLSALVLWMIAIFSKRMTKGIINITLKILKFFKVKNIEEKREKLETELGRYQESAKYVKNNKNVMIKTLLTTYIQYIVFYSISYWVYCSLGLSEHNIFEIITVQAVLYATVSGIPSPGAVGVSEGGFIALYKKIYTAEKINGAMMISRGISFYLFVIITAIVVIVNTVRDKKETEIEEVN